MAKNEEHGRKQFSFFIKNEKYFYERNHLIKRNTGKHVESGLVTRNRVKHVTENTLKKQVEEVGRKRKRNELRVKNSFGRNEDTSTEVKILESHEDHDVSKAGLQEMDSGDDTSKEFEILERDEIIKRGLSTRFFPSTNCESDHGVPEAEITNSDENTATVVETIDRDKFFDRGTSSAFVPSTIYKSASGVLPHVKIEVNEEGQDGKCNEKKNTEMIEQKNIDHDTSSEVEILDTDEVIKGGTSNAFVPSTTYMNDFEKASSDYRETVLKILKKPFDKEEYLGYSKNVKAYLANYPGLKIILKKFRYERLKRMNILRGFFYWLQNVVHHGAFQPWEDSQCLAVQPGSE